MKSRIFLFLVFQFAAWWMYFNWGKEAPDMEPLRSLSMNVHEIAEIQFVNQEASDEFYQLELRNDGIYTRRSGNQFMEAGLWHINYDIPALVLQAPGMEYRYRILGTTGNTLEIELINTHEILQAREERAATGEEELFSSTPFN